MLVASDDADGSVTLDVDGVRREVAYRDVARARVQVEFARRGTSSGTSDPQHQEE